jgi:hypothetical protein
MKPIQSDALLDAVRGDSQAALAVAQETRRHLVVPCLGALCLRLSANRPMIATAHVTLETSV